MELIGTRDINKYAHGYHKITIKKDVIGWIYKILKDERDLFSFILPFRDATSG